MILIVFLFAGCYVDTTKDRELWPQGIIMYKFIQSNPLRENLTKQVMTEYSKLCCVYFVESEQASLHISFDDGRSFAHVGFKYNKIRVMNIGRDSEYVIFHEIGHVLGLIHEHQRPDRDQALTVHIQNVIPEKIGQYDIQQPLIDYSVFEYDEYSIMQYHALSYSIDDISPTYEYIKETPHNALIQNTTLSAGDIEKIRAMYPFR